MNRTQAESLLPELVVVHNAIRKAKDREAALARITNAIDWQTVDDAGNNIATVLAAVRAGVKRTQS